MDLTVGWCSEFEPAWRVGRLLRASRPPALFQYHLGLALAAAGDTLVGRAILDEDLGLGGLSPAAGAALAQSDVAYLSSHGRMDDTATYRLRLRVGEWAPTLAQSGPAVLVLDTCDVVGETVDPAASGWLQAGRMSPALVLGFVGPATDGYSASMRGRAFAEHLAAGSTFAEAWFAAIRDTQPRRRRDRAIAMAFGSSEADARATLDTASLTNQPTRALANACWWRSK